MLRRIKHAVSHPRDALYFLGKRILDRALTRSATFESLAERALADRRLPRALTRATDAGLPVKTVYDIGARHGEWSRQLKQWLAADFILFEANEVHAANLERRGFRYFTKILSDKEREVEWIGKGGTGDSYFRENSSTYAGVPSQKIRATTLDSLIREHSLPLPDLIKLDTQGSELDIMRGGKKALLHASFVYIECSLVDYNAGAPQLPEVLTFMKSMNFIPCDVGEDHRKAGALIQLDVLFIREELYRRLDPEAGSLFY